MNLKQFKQLGLKSGDEIECDYQMGNKHQKFTGKIRQTWSLVGNTGCGPLLLCEDDYVFGNLKNIKIIKQSTKKKEKKEVDLGSNTDIASKTFQKEANHIFDQYNATLEQMQKRTFVKGDKGFREEKPIKSLSTLEVGDEVRSAKYGFDNIPFKVLLVGKNEYILEGPKGFEVWTVEELDDCEFGLITKPNTSIIDEMIEYFQQKVVDTDPIFNKFITYLKKLKHAI